MVIAVILLGQDENAKHLIEVIVLLSNILNRVLQPKSSYSVSDQLQAQNGVKERVSNGEKKIKKPFVCEIRSNRLARMSFACEHNGWSDESPFVLRNQCAEFCCRINKEKEDCRSMQGTVKHRNGVCLNRNEGRLNTN